MAKFLVNGKLVDGAGNELNKDGSIKNAAPAPASSPVKLPEDAKERLVAIKGVSEAMADTIIEALQAAPKPAPAEQE